MSKINTKQLVTMGLMTAMCIVLNRFLSIRLWSHTIGVDFIPMVITAMLYGPVAAAVVYGLADFLGAVMFPIGAYYFGFTVSAMLHGLVFGLLLYKKEQNFWRMLIAVAISQFGIALFVSSYWISDLYGSVYWPLVASRVIQVVPLSLAEIVMIPILGQIIKRLDKSLKLLREA